MKKAKSYYIKVKSDSKADVEYEVILRKDGTYYCSCPSFKYNTSVCKHIKKAIESGKLYDSKIETEIHTFVEANRPFCFTAKWMKSDKALNYVIPSDKERYVVAFETLFKYRTDGTLYYRNNESIARLDKNKDAVYGWWDDEKKVYIVERCRIFKNLQNAQILAKTFNQKYIYDLAAEHDIHGWYEYE